MRAFLRKAGESCHRMMAKSKVAAGIYFRVLPQVSRRLSRKSQQRLRNSINSVRWPDIPLGPRQVMLGDHTQVSLHPHFHEFDIEAALSSHLNYEREVFAFLETQMSNYQTVVEIGANVGVFTVFFSKYLGRRGRPGRVFAFEPSRRAYERLLQNVSVNRCRNVSLFNCAIGSQTGFVPFFEPEGHLTNGSLDLNFASQFASQIEKTPVLVVNGALVESLSGIEDRVLVKIDAEGAEAQVLRSLRNYIQSHKPDILLEVLAQYEAELNALMVPEMGPYRFFNITADGLVSKTRLMGCTFRDYFLTTSSEFAGVVSPRNPQ